MKKIILGNHIINIPILLAPMAGVTDYPFRTIVRKFGDFLTCSEMISSEALKRNNKRTIDMIPSNINGIKYVQIFGANPESMSEAAKINESFGADILDINMGCPAKKIVNTFAGSALMKDEKLAKDIITAVTSSVKIPVTLKIRLGWDHANKNCVNIAKIAEDCGISMITVHGRTRSDLYSGVSDWKFIKQVKDAVQIPVICNGDIVSEETAKEALLESGADGIMIGRGALGKPWILRNIYTFLNENRYEETISNNEKHKIILEHIDLVHEYYGDIGGTSIFKKHAAWYINNEKNASLYRVKINQSETINDMKKVINEFFESLA